MTPRIRVNSLVVRRMPNPGWQNLSRNWVSYKKCFTPNTSTRYLVVLQALDTGGKDGTIRAVFSGINPQGVHVASFKVPTAEELDHDFLWRVHSKVPGKGELVIFNRSHYEDVLVVRVHHLVSEDVWRKRYAEINNFEQMLAEEGTTILKFYLNVTKDEQKKRLQKRLDDPRKRLEIQPRGPEGTRLVG